MATMGQKLRDALVTAFGYTRADEFDDLLDSTSPTAMSDDLRQKIRFWLANDVAAVELEGILEAVV